MNKESSVKKVLHIVHGFGAGGAETWLLNTVKYLHDHPDLNLKFDFIATGGERGVFDEEIERYGSNIFYITYSIKRFFGFRVKFKKILDAHKYIAIHDHQDFISGWHFLLGIGSLPPIRISHLHNPYNFVKNYNTSPIRWLSFRIGRILMVLLTSKISGTSNAVMDEYGYNIWPYRIKRVKPVYCGFKVSEFAYNITAKQILCDELGWNNNFKIALFIGRIGEPERNTNQKNSLFAFEIAQKLVSTHNEWRFVFVGQKGPLGIKMENELYNLGLNEKIKFLGVRTDIPSILSTSSVFVFPSLWEGLGMVSVEAQANGLPVLQSNTVPSEAIVCKEIVIVKDLASGPEEWVENITELQRKSYNDRLSYNVQVSNSPFAIETSISNLIELYSGNEN